jgi:hypothetical protein
VQPQLRKVNDHACIMRLDMRRFLATFRNPCKRSQHRNQFYAFVSLHTCTLTHSVALAACCMRNTLLNATQNTPVNGAGKRPRLAEQRTGRGRGAKRSAAFAALSVYSEHFTALVALELQHEKELIYDRLMRWSPKQLTDGGYALMRLVCSVHMSELQCAYKIL